MFTEKSSSRKPQLKDRLRLIGLLLDTLPDLFYVVDADVSLRYANSATLAMASETPTVPAKHIVRTLLQQRELAPDGSETGRDFRDLCIAAFRGESMEPVVVSGRRSDATFSVFAAHLIPFDDPASGTRLLLGASRDITSERDLARKSAEVASSSRELEIGRHIQQSLLPHKLPAVPELDIAAACVPASSVGGDFYDVIECGEGRWGFVLGDVTGHGVGAGILAATTRAYLRVLLRSTSFHEAMTQLDRNLSDDFTDGAFVTLAALLFDPSTTSAQFLSAGHGPNLFLTPGDAQLRNSNGPPLGIGAWREGTRPCEIPLPPGGAVVLMSDGLFETRNASDEELGVERLGLAAALNGTAQETLTRCLECAEGWATNSEAADDRTVLVIRRLGHD